MNLKYPSVTCDNRMIRVLAPVLIAAFCRSAHAGCTYAYPSALPACAPPSYECNTESAATNNVECLGHDQYCKPFEKGADEGICTSHKTQSFAYGAPCITSNASLGTRDRIIASGAMPIPLDYLECENTAPGLSCSGNAPATSTSKVPYPAEGVGTCVAALSGAGDACRSDAECPAKLTCRSDGTCNHLSKGDPCDFTTELLIVPQCERGSYCDITNPNPVCTAAKSPGATCNYYAGECGFTSLCTDQGNGPLCVEFESLGEGQRDTSVELAGAFAGPGSIIPSILCKSELARVPAAGGADITPVCAQLPANLDSMQY